MTGDDVTPLMAELDRVMDTAEEEALLADMRAVIRDLDVLAARLQWITVQCRTDRARRLGRESCNTLCGIADQLAELGDKWKEDLK